MGGNFLWLGDMPVEFHRAKTSQIYASSKVSKAEYWRILVSWEVTPCCRV